jgi:uncharacterized repeat protein (TIGR03833 family)
MRQGTGLDYAAPVPVDPSLKHRPFASLQGREAPNLPRQAPPPSLAPVTPLGRLFTREEPGDGGVGRVRVIGAPPGLQETLGKRLRSALGCTVWIEGKDLLVDAALEPVAAWLRGQGATEVVVVRRPVAPAPAGVVGGTRRSEIRRGLRVAIVTKADQPTGALTEGVVRDLLTSSAEHPRGIKVRLESGEVGRVRRILG